MNYKELIRSAVPYLDTFDYDNYPRCFEEFSAQVEPLFAALSPETLIREAEDVVKLFFEEYRALPRREQKERSFKDKQVLALFLTPAALKAGGNASEFARTLCEVWGRQFPRNRYFSGTYESIMKGFDANLLGLPLRKSKKR